MAAPISKDPQSEGGPVVVKLGRTEVRIYRRPADRGRAPGWLVADYSTGKRRLLSFSDLKAARAEASRIAARINAGDLEGASMTGDERRQLVRATELVSPFNIDVPTACALFVEAATLVGGPHEVVAAAKEYARRHPAAREKHPLKETAEAYLQAKELEGRSSRTLKSLEFYLGRFVASHPGKAVGDFTGPDLQRWMDKLTRDDGQPLSAISRQHYRVILGGFFGHCHRRGMIVDNPASTLERVKGETEGDIGFWTPEETASLLGAVDPIARPALVIQLFCGLRATEACELVWRDVDLEAGHVEVARHKSKTRSRRLAPIPANAKPWLLALRRGPAVKVYPEHPDTYSDRVTAACKQAGIRRIPNGARHSAITYKTALSGDVARTALDCGTSPEMIFRHYRGLATKTDAQRFFDVAPEDGAAVVPFPKEANG